MNEAFIFDVVRTPIGRGKPNGKLYEVKPIDLLGTCLSALQARNSLDQNEVEDLIIGCVTPIQNQGHNIAKAALLHHGWPHSTGGFQLNRFGASGLDAINLAAMKVSSGWENLIIAGGVESMSRIPIRSDGGPLLSDPEVINNVGYLPLGVAADLIASLEGHTRHDLDSYAAESHKRASFAWKDGLFKNSIVPIIDRNGLLILERDETIRIDVSIESLSVLPASFEESGKKGFDEIALRKYPQTEKINHLHTAGNSSSMGDGASLALIGSKNIGEKLDLRPRAKIISTSNISVEPTIMLTGVVPAVQKALSKAHLDIKDIDLWEINEAFAAQILQCQARLEIGTEILNVNGGAIAHGHPLGATGAMLVSKLLDELERRDLETGVVGLPANGGMGVATIIQRI